MNPRELTEFESLRATIRERSTARGWVFLAGLVAWAALALASLVTVAVPVAAFVPLLVLAGTFEVVFAFHVAVERVGRYLQVFYEESEGAGSLDTARWEHTAMAFGRPMAGTGSDPLFTLLFALAILSNLLVAISAGPTPVELGFITTAHLVGLGRLVGGRLAAARQRSADLDRFRELKRAGSAPPAGR